MYKDFLFVVSYDEQMLYIYIINDDLSLTSIKNISVSSYISDSDLQYVGTLLVPASNTTLYYSYTMKNLIKFSLLGETEKITSFITQGETFSPTSDANAISENVLEEKIFYSKNGKSTGTMPNNEAIEINPSDKAQLIPLGYHNGQGKVLPTDITKLQEYKECLEISELILSEERSV